MSILIVTDASSDMEQAELEAKHVHCVALPVTFGDTTYDTIDKDLFFEKLAGEGTFPHTSQPSPQAFYQLFEQARANGDEVVAILLSSALSGTFQSALLAKNMGSYDNVRLIDSLSATVAVKLLVDQAVSMRDAGCTAQEIADAIEALKTRTRILAVIDTLEYLYKGGRLTRAQAGIGTLAHLKPLITLNREGSVQVIGKGIGRNRATQALLRELAEHKPDTAYPILPVYSRYVENCSTMLEKIRLQAPDLHFDEPRNIGAVIGTHIGEGAYGIVYIEQ